MEEPLRSHTSTIDIYIKLAQYPILGEKIRERMREEIFRRGIIGREEFEAEIEQKAIESQKREGVYDPFNQEVAGVWQERKARIRDFQTDFYFGTNLPTSLFERLVQETLRDQQVDISTEELSFNPELAPWELLFSQGERYEALPPPELERVRHHLDEIKAVLIKGMISDQLPYIGVARRVFDIADLRKIHRRRIGRGKIGGKSAGMLLAWKILQQPDPEFGPSIGSKVDIPESYFIGTEVIYQFRLQNNLDHLMNQKYRSLDEIRNQYPEIVKAHLKGRFPEKIYQQLRDLLARIGNVPIIVRSSSLLEDNFGFSFAGKYHSYFLPNQGSERENLDNLLDAIRQIYASTLNPEAIFYRKQNQLIDYDERMAILLQTVQGRRYGNYFFPSVAGVGFSQNNLRWNPDLRREDGFLRIVWGLGTRAVEHISNDYPRLIALSHPQLRPETTAKAISRFSQHYVDLLNLETNRFETHRLANILKELSALGYPHFRTIASINKGDFIQDLVSVSDLRNHNLVLTFDRLAGDHQFVKLMRTALIRLQHGYERPVDIEFTVEISDSYPQPEYRLNILQCRPLSIREMEKLELLSPEVDEDQILFKSFHLIPDGRVDAVRYVIFVDPRKYRQLSQQTTKLEIGRAIGRLNKVLEGRPFIMMGPGRWGSSNIDLGVRVTYADIYNTKALVEMSVEMEGVAPILSYGTHFYQDLVESGIHSLPLHLDDPKSRFDWEFFDSAVNLLASFSPQDVELSPYLKLVDVQTSAQGKRLTIIMNSELDEAIGFLVEGSWPIEADTRGTVSTF